MAKREILTYPNPVLNEISKPVTVFDRDLGVLVDDMLETMYPANGIGLAAPQIGVLQRVIVVDISDKRNEPLHFINPEVTWKEGKICMEEGCLSVPDYRDDVERPAHIKVRAQDKTGKTFELEADELLAVCIQHEIDHLNGILFVNKISRLKREFFRRWFNKRQPND